MTLKAHSVGHLGVFLLEKIRDIWVYGNWTSVSQSVIKLFTKNANVCWYLSITSDGRTDLRHTIQKL